MLQSLHIENYALIRQTDITFDTHFVAITGETGAGKSILLGALGLLLGKRADLGVLLNADRKCIVEALFDITDLGLRKFFDDNELDYDDQLILRREILPTGKSRAFINDTPTGLPVLKALGPHLIDIHSQHETLHLAEGDFQLAILDNYRIDGTLPTQRHDYDEAYHRYAEAKHQLELLTATEANNRKEQDYLQFLFDELTEANLQTDEQAQLEEESQLLAHMESVKQNLGEVVALCNDDNDSAALSQLQLAKGLLTKISAFNPTIAEYCQRLESSLIELHDIMDSLESLNDQLNYDPERQRHIDERLDTLYRLEKKHNVDSVERLLNIRNTLDQQLQHIAGMDQQIKQAMEQVDQTFADVQACGKRLSQHRRQAATLVEQQLQPYFAAMGMPEAHLNITIQPLDTCQRNGCDQVDFLFNANRGGQLREIGKVASGGELSRLMLALKALMAQQSLLPTIIFDEIDSGISGEVSTRVARIMKEMGQSLQIIAITHLPQVAAAAQQHLKVYKTTEADVTTSRIRTLTPKERIYEIATMLSADPPTAAALQTAQELLTH